MPPVGFETTTPAFEGANTVHTLDIRGYRDRLSTSSVLCNRIMGEEKLICLDFYPYTYVAVGAEAAVNSLTHFTTVQLLPR
jgi:hypothetical protein